ALPGPPGSRGRVIPPRREGATRPGTGGRERLVCPAGVSERARRSRRGLLADRRLWRDSRWRQVGEFAVFPEQRAVTANRSLTSPRRRVVTAAPPVAHPCGFVEVRPVDGAHGIAA